MPQAIENKPFKWIGGDLALDFNNTIDWLGPDESEAELLSNPERLVAWSREAGLVSERQQRDLLQQVEEDPATAQRVLERAHALRRTIHELFLAVSHGEAPDGSTVAGLNGWLRKAPVQLEVTSDEPEFGWTWAAERGDLSTVLHPVAWAASQLLVSPELQRVNACANERCGWMFVDTSRKHNRKWCEMKVCGNRAKARRFYARKHGDQTAAD